jgi:hypothetical protein
MESIWGPLSTPQQIFGFLESKKFLTRWVTARFSGSSLYLSATINCRSF